MQLSAALDLVGQIRWILMTGIPPVLRAIYASPSLIFDFTALSRISMATVWVPFGEGTDAHAKVDKTNLITPNATGIVLDLGSGHGYTPNYLDRTKVTQFIAVEPNVLMHSSIRQKAEAAGFSEADGSLLILSCGAEDTASILSSLRPDDTRVQAKVDTIISVLTICTIPAPQQTLRALVDKVLAPGGEFLFYEHVLSPRADVAWWQQFWTPVWSKVLDGCTLNRPTHIWVDQLVNEDGESFWAEGGSAWNSVDFPEENLFCRRLGRFVKK
ncbi:hypothetical protein C8F04DRAFT_1224076 [Mycena alexandri]|uniref:S-adenosyl-L-methionine-dependent methyltransferase n=1 Tax=Mycena alexandri TaxID=1745969 RepID=A0AAD6WQJ0_9AGAR|nr:hypothetical protein C8F04DRAFT_1224076 [Mycena alexandri]